MDGKGSRPLVAVVLATACASVAIVTACSGDDDPRSTTTTPTSARVTPPPGLPRAVYPRCGTERFPRPEIDRLRSETKQRIWTVSYSRRPDPEAREQTTSLVIAEYSPELPRTAVPGAPDVPIAGRRVSFREPTPKTPGFAAQWKTRRARYALIANGSDPRIVRRVIACLP